MATIAETIRIFFMDMFVKDNGTPLKDSFRIGRCDSPSISLKTGADSSASHGCLLPLRIQMSM
ncbi:hypothetical protein OAH93_00515 [Flavobacteriales bacterium]|nr:hypothetical protein [Flavobacteriales bacterium]